MALHRNEYSSPIWKRARPVTGWLMWRQPWTCPPHGLRRGGGSSWYKQPGETQPRAHTRPNAGLMLGQRLRRWPDIKPAFGYHLLFAVILEIAGSRDSFTWVCSLYPITPPGEIVGPQVYPSLQWHVLQGPIM